MRLDISNDADREIEQIEKRYEQESKYMRKVNVIGVGPGNPDMVTLEALQAIRESDALIGAGRAVATAKEAMDLLGEKKTKPTCETFKTEEIISYMDMHPEYQSFACVFTGDTSVYSGAVPLRKALKARKEEMPETEEFIVNNFAGVSSIQYFLSKRAISMADVKLVSLHGRTMDLVPIIRENRFVCVLLGDEDSVAKIAEKLVQFGLCDVNITVGERLSYQDECFTSGNPREIRLKRFDPLAIALFENDAYRPRVNSFGIADDHFARTDGIPITKRDVRALSLCRLAIHADSIIYDIGAGSGSIAIEAALACPEGRVYAVECNEDAVNTIERNRYAFQVDNIRILQGMAPACLNPRENPDAARLPKPDCVFIGGSKGRLFEIVDWALGRNPDAIIVINTVTLETLAEVLEIEKRLTEYKFEMVEVQATGMERRGSYHMYRAENPITITRISKR